MKKVTDMKKKNLFLAILLVGMLFVSGAGICMADGYTMFSYNTALPTGEMRDFLTDFSWLGFTGQFTYFAAPNLSVGLLSGFQTLYDKEKYTEEQDSLST